MTPQRYQKKRQGGPVHIGQIIRGRLDPKSTYAYPVDVYFSARQCQDTGQSEILLNLDSPRRFDLVRIQTGIVAKSINVYEWGVLRSFEPDAHAALEQIHPHVYAVAASAISNGTDLRPERLRKAISDGLRTVKAPPMIEVFSIGIDRIKELFASRQITEREKRERLYALQQVFERMKTVVILMP
jgi:hypothetical protein